MEGGKKEKWFITQPSFSYTNLYVCEEKQLEALIDRKACIKGVGTSGGSGGDMICKAFT